MNNEISRDDKVDFIRSVLNSVQVKRREAVWILNYIVSQDDILRNLCFIEDDYDNEIHGEGNYVALGTVLANPSCLPVYGYFKGKKITDPERIFHSIRLNRDIKLYIKFNLGKNERNQIKDYWLIVSSSEDMVLSEAEMNHIEDVMRRSLIYGMKLRIDKYLDEKEYDKVKQLSETLQLMR